MSVFVCSGKVLHVEFTLEMHIVPAQPMSSELSVSVFVWSDNDPGIGAMSGRNPCTETKQITGATRFVPGFRDTWT